jgi:hypothetical protein
MVEDRTFLISFYILASIRSLGSVMRLKIDPAISSIFTQFLFYFWAHNETAACKFAYLVSFPIEFSTAVFSSQYPLKIGLVLFTSLCKRSVKSQDSAGGIATGYGLDDRGIEIRVPVGSRSFSSPRRPDRLWDSLRLLSNGYRGLFPQG